MRKNLDTPLCLPESFIQTNLESLCAMLGGERPQAARLNFSTENAGFELHGSVAVVPIQGVIWQEELWWSDVCSSEKIAQTLGHLEQAANVEQVILRINSPGGMSFAGVEISEAVKRLGAVKPVHAFVNGEGCSAAYRIACCAKSITAAKGSLVGSIGTYILAYDYSQMLQREGIRPVLIKSGPNKGTGAFGVKITPEQEERLQGVVDSITADFYSVVSQARGLSMDDVATWGDGGYWTAEDGIKLKLVDRICDWSTFLSEFQSATTGCSSLHINPKGGDSMSTKTETTGTASPVSVSETTEPKAATVKELKKAFPKASSDFIVAQLEKGATLDEAKTEYIAFLETKIETFAQPKNSDEEDDDEDCKKSSKSKKKSKSETDDEDEDDEDSKKSKTAGSLGNKPHAQSGKTKAGQTATDQWNEAIDEMVAKGMSKAQAVKAVVAENPELHEAYLKEFNANAKANEKR